jgi:hypothetical protein
MAAGILMFGGSRPVGFTLFIGYLYGFLGGEYMGGARG